MKKLTFLLRKTLATKMDDWILPLYLHPEAARTGLRASHFESTFAEPLLQCCCLSCYY